MGPYNDFFSGKPYSLIIFTIIWFWCKKNFKKKSNHLPVQLCSYVRLNDFKTLWFYFIRLFNSSKCFLYASKVSGLLKIEQICFVYTDWKGTTWTDIWGMECKLLWIKQDFVQLWESNFSKLLAQLVEHYTAIAEVKGSIPV